MFCPDCERSFPVSELQSSTPGGKIYRCRLCGGNTILVGVGNEARTTTPSTSTSTTPLELLLQQTFTSGAAAQSQVTSEKTLASLKVIVVEDVTRGLDPQLVLRAEGVEGEAIAIPAKFGATLKEDEALEGGVVECDPIYANVKPLRNPSEMMMGKFALVERGGDASFVFKAEAVQEAGAIGMLLVQSEKGVFPFTAAPGRGEEEEARARRIVIPVVTVSRAVGERLRRGATKSVSIIKKNDREASICSICYEDMGKTRGERVVQLPCLHRFHEPCVVPWLTKNASNCPLCRYELEETRRVARTMNDADLVQAGWFF